MRISDWSSDVCSSDLPESANLPEAVAERWADQWGDAIVAAAAAAWSGPPPIDLSFAAEPGDEEWADEIGRASCRERVCQYVKISVVAVSQKKKQSQHYQHQLYVCDQPQ